MVVAVVRHSNGGSRKRKKAMPGGLRRLCHVIRPGPAPPAPLACSHFPSVAGASRPGMTSERREGLACCSPCPGRGCCLTAPRAQRPGSARVMPREPPSLPSDIEGVGRRAKLLPFRFTFCQAAVAPHSVSLLRHPPTGCQMWPWVLNPPEVDRFWRA